MMDARELFRFCACCPNPCRHAIPATATRQVETDTPSALSMIALAVIDGHLSFDAEVRRAMSHTQMALLCRAACPYDLDVVGTIEALVAQHTQDDEQPL